MPKKLKIRKNNSKKQKTIKIGGFRIGRLMMIRPNEVGHKKTMYGNRRRRRYITLTRARRLFDRNVNPRFRRRFQRRYVRAGGNY